MVGVYALPPILKHYYGEKVVSVNESYKGGGKSIILLDVSQASEPLGEAAAGMRREDFFAHVEVHSNDDWRPLPTDFTLEFKELDDWQRAVTATVADQPLDTVIEHHETTIELHFVIEVPKDSTETLTVEALHIADPRVKFEVAWP